MFAIVECTASKTLNYSATHKAVPVDTQTLVNVILNWAPGLKYIGFGHSTCMAEIDICQRLITEGLRSEHKRREIYVRPCKVDERGVRLLLQVPLRVLKWAIYLLTPAYTYTELLRSNHVSCN